MTISSGIDIEVLTNLDVLEGVVIAWRALWHRIPSATPFQMPEWLLTWWRHFARGELRVVALRRDGELTALCPFSLRHANGANELHLIGESVSDYLDVLMQPEHEAESLAAVAAWLTENNEWSSCDFQELRATSPLLRLRVGDSRDEQTPHSMCPVIDLRRGEKAARELICPRLLRDVEKSRLRAERAGESRIESATPETFQELLDELMRLHELRWRDRAGHGTVSLARDFYAEVLSALFRCGVARLYAWRVGSRVIAAVCGLVFHNRAALYLSGFDPKYSRFSPGNVTIHHALTEAVREGATEFDFLRGDEAYKYRWGARNRVNQRRVLRRTVTAISGRRSTQHFRAAVDVNYLAGDK